MTERKDIQSEEGRPPRPGEGAAPEPDGTKVTTANEGWAARETFCPDAGSDETGLPDVVVPVGPGNNNEELRYSLRSLRYLPHRRVVICGHAPPWLRDVKVVPLEQRRSKYENSTANLLAACRLPDLTEEFILWNDDFFLLEPIERVPVLHRGPVSEVAAYYRRYASGAYFQGMQLTSRILAKLGHPAPLSYELHVPMPMRKSLFLDAISRARAPGMPRFQALHKRTLYGNIAGLGGKRVEDVKVHDHTFPWKRGPLPFVSTTARTFRDHEVGQLIRDLHPDPSPYERRL